MLELVQITKILYVLIFLQDVENIREMFLKSFGGEIQDPLELYERECQDKIETGITE